MSFKNIFYKIIIKHLIIVTNIKTNLLLYHTQYFGNSFKVTVIHVYVNMWIEFK